MPLVEGQRLNLHFHNRQFPAEVVKTEWLNPHDQIAGAKRDANPIYKVTVHVAGLDHDLIEQIELLDEHEPEFDKHLEDIFSAALQRDQLGH